MAADGVVVKNEKTKKPKNSKSYKIKKSKTKQYESEI